MITLEGVPEPRRHYCSASRRGPAATGGRRAAAGTSTGGVFLRGEVGQSLLGRLACFLGRLVRQVYFVYLVHPRL